MHAKFEIEGEVCSVPVKLCKGVTDTKEFYRFAVQCRQGDDPGKWTVYTVEAWGKEAKASLQRLSLQRGDAVLVCGRLGNYQRRAKDGNMYDNVSLYVTSVQKLQKPSPIVLPQETEGQRRFRQGELDMPAPGSVRSDIGYGRQYRR